MALMRKNCELVVVVGKISGQVIHFGLELVLLRTLMQYTIREEKVKLAATDHVSDSCALFA